MSEITTGEVKDLLVHFQGQEISLDKIRKELRIDRNTKSFDSIRNIILQLSEQKVIRYISRGNYKIVKPVSAIRVFEPDRVRRAPFDLMFPRDFDTGMELDFAQHVVVREGDLISLGGVKSRSKTLVCLSFCGENIDSNPVLMGNEYTVMGENGYEPSARFMSRLDRMSERIDWTNEDGSDKFELLPVTEDYAEHVVKNRINIIDWINIDAGKLYDIGRVLENIKRNIGRGVAIIALQKSELSNDPRGGQFVRDFSDLEILLDGYGDSEYDVMMTVKGVKEATAPIVGKKYAYTVGGNGTQIINFRPMVKCPECHGSKFIKGQGKCDHCYGTGYAGEGDKGHQEDMPFS